MFFGLRTEKGQLGRLSLRRKFDTHLWTRLSHIFDLSHCDDGIQVIPTHSHPSPEIPLHGISVESETAVFDGRFSDLFTFLLFVAVAFHFPFS